MRLKNSYLYQVKEWIRPVIIFYSVVFLITVLSSISAFIDDSSVISVFGWDFAVIIFMFVVGCSTFSEDFPMHLQNSVSRKTFYGAKILSVLSISAIVTAVYTVFSLLIHIVFQFLFKNIGAVEISSLFEQIYFNSDEIFSFSMYLWVALIIFAASVFVCMLGVFISAVFYRAQKLVKISLAVGVPAIFIVVLPIVDVTLFSGTLYTELFRFLGNVFGIFEQLPWKALVSFGVLFAVSAVAGWLLIRKAPIKNK